METSLQLYVDENIATRWLFDDGSILNWDNGSKAIILNQYEASAFPNVNDPVVITDFTFTAKRMGAAPTITASFYYHRCLDKLWTYNVFTVFNGERYFIKQIPTSGIANTDGRYHHSIELVSERILLDNVYFYDVVNSVVDSDKPVSNNSKFEFFGDINEFVRRINESLQYRGIDYSVVIDDGVYSDAVMVSFEDRVISEVLQEIYNTYKLPYYFDGKVIHVGYTNNAITHTFKYGSDEALLSINKENANYKVVTAISGSGSEDNIPYYYPNDYESKEEVEANGGTWINPSTTLQPPIYRESLGKERFYKAQDYAYTIPGTTETYKFDNIYVDGKPKEHILDLSDIKPTITGIKNALGYGIDTFLDFAYDENDSDEMDEEGNYLHPYFFAKLRKFDGSNGFNLFDHAIDEAQMTISMTSGNCGGCEWVIGVGEDTQKNLVQVDSDGNLLRDENGNVRCGRDGMPNEEPQDRQNDTSKYEVWIALKKDNSTFGEVMPNANRNYKPSVTDTFVILHIDLPKAYVLAAEERLKDALIAYMADNNSEKFNFSISFSRIFFAENPDILAQLNENARVQLEYNGDYIELYVSSFSYTMSKDIPLPEIKVELSDTLTISQNALQTIINDLKGSGFGLGSGASGDILKLGLAYFLRKDVNDRTHGKLSTDVGFEVGKYVSGASGAIMFIDKQTGKTTAELDKLYVRVKAYFETLEIVNVNSVGGKQIISPAGSMKCVKVENDSTKSYYRCYVLSEQDGEKIENRFHVGDQVYSQMFNAKPSVSNKVSNHYWWRLCVGVGDDYIDLSKSDCDVDSDAPAVGDIMCHRGNRDDIDRQNFLEFSSVDAFSPNITLFQGVNSYSLVDKDIISYGVDKTTNQAFMNIYGNMYVGDRGGSSFLRYTIENGLELKGRLNIGTTFGDTTLEEALKKASETYKEDLDPYKLAMEKEIANLQGQIDGAIESWFYDLPPTLGNLPASKWTTDEMRNIHLGDLYYSGEGRAYRFQYNTDTEEYYWNEIVDNDIILALDNAKKAQDTADSKRKTFVRQPTVDDDYDIGDIWLNATYDDGTTKYDNDMLRAITAKAKGIAFSIDHWTLASKYTDDTVAKDALQKAKDAFGKADTLQTTVKNMKEFADDAFRDGIITYSETVGIAQYIKQIETVKAQVEQSYTEMVNNSLLQDGIAKTNLQEGYKNFIAAANTLVEAINTAIEDKIATSDERSAVDKAYNDFNTKYGDYTSYLNAAIKYIEEQLDVNIRGYQYLKDALAQETTTEGGLILTSAVVLGYTDADKNRITMSGINGLVNTKGTRTPAFWVGGDMVDIFDYYNSSTGKFDVPAGVRPATGMDRMDGTGYRAGGALWWDSDGMLHADPLSFFVGENTVGALLASFQVVFKADNISPDYLIPQVPFQSLNIATTLNLGKYIFDPATDALKLTRSDGKDANFAATGDIVAYSAGDYDLVSPIASASALGMIKIGEGLSIADDGTVSATGGGTIGSVNVDGAGNAITAATVSGTGLILTKGLTFFHTGNDGAGSGLDADFLDGLQATAFTRADQSPAVDLNTVNGKGIMTNTANANATTERNYPIAEAGTLFYGTAAYSSANQIYGSYNSNRWFARGGGSSTTTKTAWKEFAFITSNVASATKLQTARTINGTSFDGTANITTTNWGTARNIYIADSSATNTGAAVSVNGSAAATLKLPATIKASLTGNATTATTLAISRSIWGQSFNGSDDVKGDMTNVGSITASGIIQTASDVVAYSSGDYDIVSPIASSAALGMIKVGANLSISADGTLSATGGGTNFSAGTGLSMGTNKVLNVVYGSVADTVCQGNDSRLSDARKNPNSLTISYGALPSDKTAVTYNGESAKSISIPTALSHLTNDKSFITGITWGMVSSAISNNGTTTDSSYFVTANGSLAQVAYSNLTGKPDLSSLHSHTNKTYLDSINQKLSTSSAPNFLDLVVGDTANVHIKIGEGSGNCINGVKSDDTVGNLYLNFTSTTNRVLIDSSSNINTTGSLTASTLVSNVAAGTKPISVTSTTLCGNLNADLLDGIHASGLFTQLANSNNNISVTIGGTNKTLTVSYATSASELSTARSIWGQSFNGTQNISGNMTGVGSITASGDIVTQGDIVAYSAGTTSAAFKYWRPYVNPNTCELSWSDSIATTTPDPVNIRGPRGYSINKVSAKSTSSAANGNSVYNVFSEASETNPIGTFTVYNGGTGPRGYSIGSIKQTASSSDSGGANTYALYTEDSTYVGSFTVYNGKQGAAGTGETNSFSGSKFFHWTGYQGLVMRHTTNGVSYGFDIREAILKVLYIGNTTTNPAEMSVIATISTSGQWTASDSRLKNIHSEIKNVLDPMLNIPVLSYDMKLDPFHKETIGITTQSIQPYFPECVDKLDDTYFSLNYASIGCIAFQGVKELYALIKQQALKISNLEKRISELENTNS